MPPVDYAHNDAREVAATLHSLFKDPATNIELWLDSDATKARLEYELREAIRGLREDDVFVFYYAGHGYHDVGGNRITAWDSSPWNAATTLLVRDTILDPLRESACRRAMLFVDACAVPVQTIVRGSRSSLTSLNPEEMHADLGRGRSCATFLSCSPGEKSYPSDEYQHGVWTHFLLSALRDNPPGALGPSGSLTDVSLRDYLSREVPLYLKSQQRPGRIQRPMAVLEGNSTTALLDMTGLTRADMPVAADTSPGRSTADTRSAHNRRQKSATIEPRRSYLAVVNTGIGGTNATFIATLTLTTDEPEELARRVETIKRELGHSTFTSNERVQTNGLKSLFEAPETQTRLLEWLSTTTFSAHLYFAAAGTLPPEWHQLKLAQEFAVLPLVHRISDRSMKIERLATNLDSISSYLDSALAEIRIKFHRDLKRPEIVEHRRKNNRALMELADLVLGCCSRYVSNLEDRAARIVFSHVRTRIKYAVNVATGERHTRDNNPLP